MPYREEIWTPIHSPEAYPKPDPGLTADVASVGFYGEEPVGWLVRQDNALDWYTNASATEGHQGGLRQLVENTITAGISYGWSAADTWIRIMAMTPIANVTLDQPLGEFHQTLRVLWGITK